MLNISMENFFKESGELSVNGSNAPILLDGKENIWFIKSGNIDVFSVEIEGDNPKGARIYLFSLGEGNILMGMDLKSGLSNRGFLAVGNTNTQLYKVNATQLAEHLSRSNDYPAFAALIDKWILGINSGIARDSDLRTDISISKAEVITIPENKKIRAKRGVFWIKINPGFLTLLDSDISGFEGCKYFPVTDNAWLMSLKSFETECIPTGLLLKENDFREVLSYYYEQVLTLEELNIRMLLVDDFVRNKEKIEKLKQVNKEAFNSITGILEDAKKTESEFGTKDALLSACKILGDYLGIKIIEPKIDKDDKKPELKDIAQASRFCVRQVSLKEGWEQKDSGALLAFTKDKNIPAVLIPNIKGQYRIIIPSEKINSKLTPDLAGKITDYAWTFYKPFPLKKITPFEFLKFIFQSCKKEVYLLLAAGCVGGVLSLFIPLITGIIIDSVIPQSDKMKLFGFGLSIVLSSFALIFAQIIRSLSYLRLDTKIDYIVQSALWDRLINLPISFFKKYSSGALAAKANSIAQLKQILSFTVINTIIYNSFMIFNLFLLFYYDLMLGFLSSILFLIYLAFIFYIGSIIKDQNNKVIQLENSISSLINQVLNSVAKIKIAGVENLAFKLWTDKYSAKQKENLIVRKSSNLITILNSMFPVFATVILYFLFTLSKYSGFSVGVLLAFMTAFNVFLLSIMQISGASITFFMAIPLYDNAKDILHSLPEYALVKESIKALKGEIEINHAYFRYDKEGVYVLSDISMTIKPGEFVAIVGTSGSGKSTLLRLLLGFETPETGAIYYDKQNIESIDKSSLRRQIGTVMQNSKLFPGNIYSNIAGVSNVSVDYVNEVARIVGLDNDLKTMPMGVFTIVIEGLSTFSGGQRQKILLAKALITQPSVLFLDEATSALDNEAQKVIAENLTKIQATRVIVAHRLSTVVDADRIIVLEKGKIVEQGSYEDLIAKDGVFAELVKRQINES